MAPTIKEDLASIVVVLCSLPLMVLGYAFLALGSPGDVFFWIALGLFAAFGIASCARKPGPVIASALAGIASIGVLVVVAWFMLAVFSMKI